LAEGNTGRGEIAVRGLAAMASSEEMATSENLYSTASPFVLAVRVQELEVAPFCAT
jgi:hypothetical protein